MGHHYRELVAWRKSVSMVSDAYRLTQDFPRDEVYGLTAQIRRAAVSIPSNIAEGQGRQTKGEFRQFLGQAFGSLLELETQIIIANNLGFLDSARADDFLNQTEEVGRIINGLIGSLSA